MTEVLIVDDDSAYGELVELTVIAHSPVAIPRRKSSLADALDYLKHATQKKFPALVVSDLNLGDGDGRDILRFLRTAGQPSRAAVIILTSAYGRHEMDDCCELGADGCFIKPSQAESLAGIIHHTWRHILKLDPMIGTPLRERALKHHR